MFVKALRWSATVGTLPALARFMAVAAILTPLLLGLCAGTSVTIAQARTSPWFYAAILLPAFVVSWGGAARARSWRRRLDRRVGDMLLASCLAAWLTLIGLLLGAHEAGGSVEEIFNGWTASVLFWAFVGLIVAIVSIARPEDEGYEARARILFRGETGPHIDHIVAGLCGTIGHYAEKIGRDITIREYHPDPAGGAGWFLLELESTMALRAYIEDAETIYTSKAEYSNVNKPPAGGRPGRIVRAECINVDGSTSRPNVVVHEKGQTIEYTTRFNRPGTCVFTVHREYWVREGEENIFELGRFARAITTRIRNLCPGHAPISMQRTMPYASGRIPLQSDEGWKTIVDRQDGKPDELIHDFYLYA